MPNEAVTIYVTKDAPTRGIRVAEIDDREDSVKVALELPDANDERRVHFLSDGGYCFTLHEAVLDAERRRARKIASLEAQIAAIRAIDLSKPVEG